MSNSINVMAAEGSSLDTVNTPLVSISKSRWIVAILSTGMIAWLAFTFPPKVWRIPDELANVGANVGNNPGRTALDMFDLGNPDLDFVKLAAGMGVEGARAETMEQFNELFEQANRRSGPFLIELVI